ncbi:MAG TPA: M1 family aminopeptidase [Gemmatimonadales bacterium]|nr:M1 family aminopeptidase [Gemmatimonadales bacterium]
MKSAATGLLLLLGATTTLVAQRQTGTIGAYTAPRSWPEQTRRFDLLHQAIHVRFDAPRRQLLGEVTTRVRLTMPTDTIRLEAENLTIDRASGAGRKSLKFTQDTSHVTVRLPRAGKAGDTVEVTVAYHGFPERGLYFVPRRNIVWSQGEATETRAWVPTYDAPNDKTTWEFFVQVDSGLVVLSNGRLVEVTPAAGGAERIWHWSQERPASTYLYSVVAGPFTILRDQWRGIPVEYYTYADTTDAAWRSFGETPEMMEIYSQVLGVPFPWAKYDQSIIPDFTYGGMENVSATTQTDLALHGPGGEPDNSGRGLNAHELAHQWFGDLTTTANWANVWLNEGLTTYMESVENERTRGWNAAALEWGGQQRAAMQADENQVRSLVWGQYEGTDPITLFFSGHVYPKGAQLAHQLRRLLGDSLFWAGMHRFLVDNAYQPVTTPDYAVAMEKTCRCDLDWFFDQWAYGIGYPRVSFTRHWDAAARRLHVTVTQTQPVDSLHPLFRFPVTLRVITGDSVVRKQIMVSRASETFAVELPSEPLSFRFDEGGWLLGTVAGDYTEPELATMAAHDLDVRGRDWAIRALAERHDSTAQAARRLVVLNEYMPELRALALEAMGADSSAATRSVLRSALRDPAGAVRAAALQDLVRLDPAGAAPVADTMYRTDPSDAARQGALAVIGEARGAAALDLLLDASNPDHPLGTRFTALTCLSRLHGARAFDGIERLTANTENRNLRIAALNALAASGDSTRAAAVALRLVSDPDPLFAVAAVRVAGRVGGEAAKARLKRALPKETRVFVRQAITRVTG